MDRPSDMGSRPLQGGNPVLPGLTGGTDLEEKSQRLKVISHFTAKISKDKDILPVASA